LYGLRTRLLFTIELVDELRDGASWHVRSMDGLFNCKAMPGRLGVGAGERDEEDHGWLG
jgi:hypothetical protein